jgi:GMP synthase (glutamine-hydrolysing)
MSTAPDGVARLAVAREPAGSGSTAPRPQGKHADPPRGIVGGAPEGSTDSATLGQIGGQTETILIIDLGAQYTQLIARRIRELNIYSEIVNNTLRLSDVRGPGAKYGKVIGLILSGGPNSAYQFGAPSIDPDLLSAGIPVLGICYGLQLMGSLLGCPIVEGRRKEFGKTEMWVDNHEDSLLFRGLNPNLICWMSHGDCLGDARKLPKGAIVTAHTDATPVAAFEHHARKLYAVQFHPEVTHTPWGIDLLRNFAYGACGARGEWTMGNFVELAVEHIRTLCDINGVDVPGNGRVKRGTIVSRNSEVICAVSGGVDSLCTAAIVDRAVGVHLHPIFVDHGFLRYEEGDKVVEAWKGHFKSRLVRINAEARFLNQLVGISDPERKRKIIGREFIRIFEEEARRIKGVGFLAQGTLYPDVIESSGIGMHAHVIKTHHNVGGLPKRMKLKLIEPLRELFKDEVRQLGLELGLPRPMVYRQPFPGPGLAIRIIGDITAERLRLLRRADKIVREEIDMAEMDAGERPWQYFAVLPVVKTVGVMGDKRTYGYPLVVRAVTSSDGMTADWSKLPHKALERITSRVIGEVKGINRVCLDITSKPPATIEWE